MAIDKRITRARKILRDGINRGRAEEAASPNRATGTRKRYKAGYEAALAAAEALDQR